jgi:mRNA-degrading endonuclease RelE of RelBE toxin-antitoxin system
VGLRIQQLISKRLKRLPSKYRLLIHSSFQQQTDAFMEQHPDSWDDVVSQFKKIITNPLQSPMHNLPPHLNGKVFHVHVAGLNVPSRKGYRLIYVVHGGQKIVLPVFLSLVIKSQFDYEKVPWLDYAEKIYKDLSEGHLSAFTEINLISK